VHALDRSDTVTGTSINTILQSYHHRYMGEGPENITEYIEKRYSLFSYKREKRQEQIHVHEYLIKYQQTYD
jgi:hypothetical protein